MEQSGFASKGKYGDTKGSVSKRRTLSFFRAKVVPEHVMKELRAQAHEKSGRGKLRARMVLLLLDGYTVAQVSEILGICEPTVRKWAERFAAEGLAGLTERPRPGQPEKLGSEERTRLLRLSLRGIPKSLPAWSIRALAAEAGVTQHQVRRLWKQLGLSKTRLDEAKQLAVELFEQGARLEVICLAPLLAGAIFRLEHSLLRGVIDRTLHPEVRQNLPKSRGSLYLVHRYLRGHDTRRTSPRAAREWLARASGELTSEDPAPSRLFMGLTPLPSEDPLQFDFSQSGVDPVWLPSIDAWLHGVECFLRMAELASTPPPALAGVVDLRLSVAGFVQEESEELPENGEAGFFWRSSSGRMR